MFWYAAMRHSGRWAFWGFQRLVWLFRYRFFGFSRMGSLAQQSEGDKVALASGLDRCITSLVLVTAVSYCLPHERHAHAGIQTLMQ